MMCYKDRRFCAYQLCGKFMRCDRAYTVGEAINASKWWQEAGGEGGPPVDFFSEKPPCYEKRECEWPGF